MFKKAAFLLSILFLLIPYISTQQIDRHKVPLTVFERPDIVVDKIKITSQPSQKPGKVRLWIEFWLSNNSSKHIKCCPTIAGKKAWNDSPSSEQLFRVRVDARYYPDGRFFKIGGTTTDLLPNESNDKYQLSSYFLKGKNIQIRVVADPGNWINEKNEKNNVKKTMWPLRMKLSRRKI